MTGTIPNAVFFQNCLSEKFSEMLFVIPKINHRLHLKDIKLCLDQIFSWLFQRVITNNFMPI